MVLELRDKLPPSSTGQEEQPPTMSAIEEDVLSALVNLGYQRAAAEKALAGAVKAGKSGSFDVLFREVLGGLSK
jgi:Holliday junction DNA helicase RuvA